MTTADPAIDIDLLVAIDPPSPDCAPGAPVPEGTIISSEPISAEGDKHDFEVLAETGYFDGPRVRHHAESDGARVGGRLTNGQVLGRQPGGGPP